MAKHRARSLRRSVVVGTMTAAAASLVAAMISVGTAGAVTAPGLSVVPKNSDVVARCNFTLQSVNPSVGTSAIRLAANAQPATLTGYAVNAYTQVHCYVFGGSSGPLLTQIDPFANGPIVPTTSENAVIPFYSSYTLCGFAFVKKNNGSQTSTPFVCASS